MQGHDCTRIVAAPAAAVEVQHRKQCGRQRQCARRPWQGGFQLNAATAAMYVVAYVVLCRTCIILLRVVVTCCASLTLRAQVILEGEMDVMSTVPDVTEQKKRLVNAEHFSIVYQAYSHMDYVSAPDSMAGVGLLLLALIFDRWSLP